MRHLSILPFVCGILSALVFTAETANILFLLPVASKSHVHVFEPLTRALGERGHNVVNLSPVQSKDMPPTVRTISAVKIEDIFKTMVSPFTQRQQGKLQSFMNASLDYLEDACNAVYDNEEVQDVINNMKFDLVIVDILLNYCMLGVLPKLGAPYIYVSTMAAPTYVVDPLGFRLPPSFVPSPFLDYTHSMTFIQRAVNLSFNFFVDLLGHFMFLPTFEKIYQQKLGIDTRIYDIDHNVSMVFINSHFTQSYPRPYLPDAVEVGGMHARPANPLSKDLETFVSGAKDGFILFSLGSIAQGKDMPEEYRKVFINVFSRLKQRVLWKWEADDMPDLPPNVKVSKWLPQQDILGHKNIKLFITHGGLLSLQETVYHGVPLLSIPLFADQDLNVKQAEKSGFSLTLEILDITEEILEAKLNELLEDQRFANRAKELSTLWKDQPQKPLDLAVFWSEYVIRHKGALHMRSASRELNFFQYHSLDVIAFLLGIIIGVFLIIKWVLKFLWNLICKKSPPESREGLKIKSKKNN